MLHSDPKRGLFPSVAIQPLELSKAQGREEGEEEEEIQSNFQGNERQAAAMVSYHQ